MTAQDSRVELAELSEPRREQVMSRWALLRPHLEDGHALSEVARLEGVPLRTAQRWLARYRVEGLAGLGRRPRSDRVHDASPRS